MAEKSARPGQRLAREEKTIATMVAMYCRAHHGTATSDDGEGLCDECAELLAYARRRLGACRYGAEKPTCANCETHCYKPAMRERVREVMRYSGPRMLRRHPVLALTHLTDGRRTPRRCGSAGGGSGATGGRERPGTPAR
ncbi:MAG: nitrous oxide-stimulated promoter family protein [Actinobacteria bacterium]|nr:nitrous oxide-stimulated promoter family protein [Actinomycetota bacterium]